VLYALEFVADKIPWLDSLWDAVHTVIRPLGGAFIAVSSLGHASPSVQVVAALIGGTMAASSHFTKAGTRVLANSSPEPFSNWALSIGEDTFVLGLAFLALRHPIAALTVSLLSATVILVSATWLVKTVRRRFAKARAET